MGEDLKVKRVQIEVEWPLTDAMVEHRGVRIAELMRVFEEMKAKARAAAKAAKKELDEMQSQIDKLASEIRSKTYMTTVEAERRPNFDTNTWLTVRIDSEGHGLIVAEDPMSAEERQMAIDVDAGQPPREPPKQVKVTRRKKAEVPEATH